MKTVHKWNFLINDHFTLVMPRGAEILAVQHQRQNPYHGVLWALVDPDAPTEDRYFQLRGTGHDATGLSGAEYIGTFQMADGALVFHMFETLRP